MGFSPFHRHNYRRPSSEDTPLGPERGTEELLRNIFGPDFYDCESKDGENSYSISSKKQIAQPDVVTVNQQSQNAKEGPIKELPGPGKELFYRYILGLHGKNDQAQLVKIGSSFEKAAAFENFQVLR